MSAEDATGLRDMLLNMLDDRQIVQLDVLTTPSPPYQQIVLTLDKPVQGTETVGAQI